MHTNTHTANLCNPCSDGSDNCNSFSDVSTAVQSLCDGRQMCKYEEADVMDYRGIPCAGLKYLVLDYTCEPIGACQDLPKADREAPMGKYSQVYDDSDVV